MNYYILIFFSLCISLVVTVLFRSLGQKLHIVDCPDNYRKLHAKPIPLIGGYAIFFSSILSLILLQFFQNEYLDQFLKFDESVIALIIGSLIILATGAYDDLKDMGVRNKLIFQSLAASLLYIFNFKINLISIPFLGSLDFSYLSYPITLFWFLGCMNVINLLDGLDGLAGGISLFAIITLTISSANTNNHFALVLNLIVIGSVLAFLVFNFNPASIFLGDAGSMLLGFYIAAMSLITSHKAEAALTLAIPFIAIGLPVFDTIVALIRRWSRRVPISTADRQHIHHILLSSGLSTRSVVLILYGICIIFSSISYLLILKRDGAAMIFLSIILVLSFIYAKRFGIINLEQVVQRIKEDRVENKRSSDVQIQVEKAIQQLKKASTIDQIWIYCIPVFQSMKLDKCYLVLNKNNEEFFWHNKKSIQDKNQNEFKDEWTLKIQIHNDRQSYGNLEVSKVSNESPVRDIFMQLNILRTEIASKINNF